MVASAPVSAQQKPNIVFILADNIGYGDIGAYGGGELRGAPTPRIDRLAADPRRHDVDSGARRGVGDPAQ